MKRFICYVMLAVLLVCMIPVPANATEMERIYLDDGSYIKVQVEIIHSRAAGSVTGNKSYTYYGSDNVSRWKAVLTGTFTHTGSSSTCTDSSIDATVYDSAWYVASKSAWESGNKAVGSITMGEKLLGVTIGKVPISLTLSCDADGNLS